MPALYIVLEKKIPNLDLAVNGNWLSKESDNLEKLAKKLQVTPLMNFFSASADEVAFMMEESGQDASEKNTAEVWFSAKDGLHTVRALLQNVQSLKATSANHVQDDLKNLERILSAAAEANVGWHLAVDY